MPEIKDGVYMSCVLLQYPSENGEKTGRGGCREEWDGGGHKLLPTTLAQEPYSPVPPQTTNTLSINLPQYNNSHYGGYPAMYRSL